MYLGKCEESGSGMGHYLRIRESILSRRCKNSVKNQTSELQVGHLYFGLKK